MTDKHIVLTTAGPIGTPTLNRPEKLNAFIDTMREEIAQGLEELGNNPNVRVVVVTGAGRGFCAGADINYLAQLKKENDAQNFKGLLEAGRRAITTIRNMDKPVIASINGPAAGGGLCLALACDLRIASDQATFGATFVKIGLHPDWAGAFFLPRLVGTAKALELMLTGEVIGAPEAERIGMVNRIVPHERLAAETEALALKLASRPPAAIREIKKTAHLSLEVSLEEMLNREFDVQMQLFKTSDMAEGVNAFLEKRAPVFSSGADKSSRKEK